MDLLVRGLRNISEYERLYTYYSKTFVKTPPEYFKKRIDNDPYLVPEDIRIAEEEGSITSSVVVLRRSMHWNYKQTPFIGIGNVSTLPEKRGNNLASIVMKDALQYSGNKKDNISILFTGINSFYEKFNYFTILAYHIIFIVKELNWNGYSIRNFDKSDLIYISKIYNSFNEHLYGPVVRDIKYWNANLAFSDTKEIFLVAEKFGSIEGYIRFVPGTNRNEIWEFGYTNRDALDALLSEVSIILNKKLIKSGALYPGNMLQDSHSLKIKYEASSLAMANIQGNDSELKNEFNNYCFWWTDNF
jgi:predicted acetyltransferase